MLEKPSQEMVKTSASFTIKDMVRNTVAIDKINGRVHAIIREPLSGTIWGSEAKVTRSQGEKVAQIDYKFMGQLQDGVSPVELLDVLIEGNNAHPENSQTVICDEAVLRQIQQEGYTITWLSEERFRLVGRPQGNIDVHLYKRGISRVAEAGLGLTLF